MANPTRIHQLFKCLYEDCDELSVARAPTSRSIAAMGFFWLGAFIDQVWKGPPVLQITGVCARSASAP
jgi:hypothetical protein